MSAGANFAHLLRDPNIATRNSLANSNTMLEKKAFSFPEGGKFSLSVGGHPCRLGGHRKKGPLAFLTESSLEFLPEVYGLSTTELVGIIAGVGKNVAKQK